MPFIFFWDITMKIICWGIMRILIEHGIEVNNDVIEGNL